MVLDIGLQDGPKPKCYFAQAALPSYIDNAHPPTKNEPFKTVLDQQYNHTVRQTGIQNRSNDITLTNIDIQTSLLLPASAVQQAFHDKVTSTGDGFLRYARVYMKPLEIISGDFFNSYIKAGNIVMLSEGRSGTDNILSLSEGVLRIEVDKPTYEKMGLEGKAVGGDGRKHVKARFGELTLLNLSKLADKAISSANIMRISNRSQPPPPINAARQKSLRPPEVGVQERSRQLSCLAILRPTLASRGQR